MSTQRLISVAAGTASTVESADSLALFPPPITVAITPGNGGTVTVEFRVTRGGAWRPVADGVLAGTLSAAASDVLLGPVEGLRFTAATADAVIEVAWGA